MKRVTIKDIAGELGVSIGTVYRALNNTGRISEATKAKVLAKAEELNYRPNLVARKFALRSKQKIFVTLPTVPDYYWDDVRLGLSMAVGELSEFGVEFESCDLPEPAGLDAGKLLLERIDAFGPDGVVLAPVSFHGLGRLLDELEARNIPVVLVNQGVSFRKRLFYYGPNDGTSGALAGELMGKLVGGRGMVCVLSRDAQLTQLGERMHGFFDHLGRNYPGIVVPNVCSRPRGEEEALLDDALDRCPDVRGLYVIDTTQSGLIAELMQKRGIEDVVLVGHEASPLSRRMLEEGMISALLCERKVCQGYYPVKLLHDYLIDGTLPEGDCLYTEINVVLRGNAPFLDEHRYGRGFL